VIGACLFGGNTAMAAYLGKINDVLCTVCMMWK